MLFFDLHITIVWAFLNCFERYLYITHALNKYVSTKVNSVRSIWSALFKMFKMFKTLLTFILLIICFISSFVMHENDIARRMNESAMSLTSIWENKEKNFLRSISVFSSNVVVMQSLLLHFNNKNWESFLNNWLLILTHFAKHYIDWDASLSLCICNLKCACFICWIILLLWSLCLKYLFHVSRMSCIFHRICNHFDSFTVSKQLWFQKSFVQFDDFIMKVNSLMISCSTLIILHTLSSIIVLLFRKWFKDKYICR